ncbi:S41 family peptidase [Patescibacteria group bacterium]|nr:S41 family peptidase [Patescibacteria group bacterium]MBU1868809.1 S41 family peptidase [Patescibacteria group bacterium]
MSIYFTPNTLPNPRGRKRPGPPSRRAGFRTLGLVLVILATLLLGWYLGYKGYYLSFSQSKIRVVNREPPADLEKQLDLTLFWKVINVLEEKYLRFSDVSSEDLLNGAISGMVESLQDPYTAFFTPAENEEFKSSLAGVYEGIGAQLGFSDHQLVVIAPLKGSPAEEVGVQSGDSILEVDGESTQGWSLAEAVSNIRGEKGTEVELTLGRTESGSSDAEMVRVKIARRTIKIPSLALEWEENDIAVVKLYRFGEDIYGEWESAVSKILGNNAKGVIIDVRNNPGGYLEGAVIVASEFFARGDIVLKRDVGGRIEHSKVDHKGRLLTEPLVVLINEGSASASEIVAGAIQARERGTLVGKKTFGKGTVQEALDLQGNAGLHVTVSDWLLPDKKSVDGEGLTPDVEVELTDEDVAKGEDPQLQRALERVKEIIGQ